jgi:hypothetical protein
MADNPTRYELKQRLAESRRTQFEPIDHGLTVFKLKRDEL